MHLTISTGIYWGLTIDEPLFWEQWIQPWGNITPRIPLHGGRQTIWKINLIANTEDEKEKEAAQGDGEWRTKVSPHWGVRPLLRGLWADLGGRGRGSGRPGEAAPHRGRAECRGHGEMPKGFTARRPGEQSKNEGSKGRDRAGDWYHCQ